VASSFRFAPEQEDCVTTNISATVLCATF